MRKFGMVLLACGAFGFYYASGEVSKYPPIPDGLSISQSFSYPAGKWQIAEYGLAMVGALGLILTLFPQGR